MIKVRSTGVWDPLFFTLHHVASCHIVFVFTGLGQGKRGLLVSLRKSEPGNGVYDIDYTLPRDA
jgi:hypothetical protein